MFKIKAICLIIFSLISINACAPNVKQPVDPQVLIIGKSLKNEISVLNLAAVINKGGLIEIQFTGKNRTPFYKLLEYRVTWLDQNGFEIPSVLTKWTEFPAFENSVMRFRTIAPSPKAKDFRLLIRTKEN